MISLPAFRSLLVTSVVLFLTPFSQAVAAASDFEGQWMLNVAVPGAEALVGQLDIELKDGEWVAFVENGPAPLTIDGNDIQIEVDTRDRQGFRFKRLLKGSLEGGTISGVLQSIDILETAAEYGEDGSAWTAVRPETVPPRS